MLTILQEQHTIDKIELSSWMPRLVVILLFQEKIQKVTDFTKSCASLTIKTYCTSFPFDGEKPGDSLTCANLPYSEVAHKAH
jgi:hypothetical protein